ncbi:MAG TPA: GNAT family N-acetyltransferase [Candidatus Thermoplasmatota archaeon]|nr:GNAT family N-acetyltransferase [Candidatus Thermoplasmatota archaeon]
MASWDYLADLQINEDDLFYERYNRGRDVKEFSCGDPGLDEFLHDPEEVARYQEDGYGTTTLVYCHGMLVGFFTLSSDALELTYVKSRKLAQQTRARKKEIVHDFPAIKIGRFAVDKRMHGKGIGRHMMRHIVGLALATGSVGVRLLILQAYPTSQAFYQKLGFEFTDEVKRERGRHNRTMFLDLWQVRDVV